MLVMCILIYDEDDAGDRDDGVMCAGTDDTTLFPVLMLSSFVVYV